MDIPGYKMLDTLGKGGMATVYLAIQESFDRKVAIKVMSAQLAQDPTFGDRFQREARIVSQMNHPNIVTVYDVGVVDNHHYLAMEYVEGKELRHRMGKMSLAEKIQATKDVAQALHYAGNKGYVHRDVKPDNVMMSEEDGRAILMDFGIAKASDGNHSMTKTGMAIGTPYYMSPEQAQGQSVDKRSDVYSLGVLFFHLLTGYVPYDAESGVAIGIKHITEPVPMLPKHLRVFQPILEKVMAKDPEKRYQSGVELVEGLKQVDMAALDHVNQIIDDESQKASATDPHAQTVMAEVAPTPPIVPPILSTGNVTTADAARVAENIAAGDVTAPLKAVKKQSPLVVLAIIVVVLAGVWFYFQPVNNEKEKVAEIDAPRQSELIVVEEADQQWEQAVADTGEADEEKAEQELLQAQLEAERLAQEALEQEKIEQEKLTQENLIAEQKIQEEKTKEEQRKQKEKLAAAKEMAKKEQAAKEKSAQKQAAQEAVEQARRDEISKRLKRAKALHESGALVLPEDDNAVLAYREVLKVDAKNSTATLALKIIESNYGLGIRTLIEQNQLGQAREQLKSASRLYPNSVVINDLLALHQQKISEQAAAKQSATEPKITKLVVSDMAFKDVQQETQKTNLPLVRNAYFGFSYKNFQGATSLLQAVLYDGSRTIKIMQKPVVAVGEKGEIFFTLTRPVEGFPEGGYVVDITKSEQRLVSISFSVSH